MGGCFDEDDGVHLIMACSSAGIFGGDCFEQTVHVGAGARVRITSQSALQIHASAAHEVAVIRSTYVIGPEPVLQCRWHPLIPFARSRLDQVIDVRLADNARLAWSDAFTAGRSARGERWAFARLAHQLGVWRSEALKNGTPDQVARLEYLERYDLEPAVCGLRDRWVAGDATSFGTMLTSGWPISAPAVEGLHQLLAGIPGVLAAADLLDESLMIVRLVADEGAGLHQARAAAEARFPALESTRQTALASQ